MRADRVLAGAIALGSLVAAPLAAAAAPAESKRPRPAADAVPIAAPASVVPAVTSASAGGLRPVAPRALDELVIDHEVGAVLTLQNDQRYGKAGTQYSRSTVALDRNLFAVTRTSTEARFLGRHTVVLLYAPLDVPTRVTLDAPLTFRGTTFAAGTVVNHRYLFDGIRATYMYRFYEGAGLQLDGGATLGVRNAEVSLTSANGEQFAAERDIGPVPALRGRLRYDAGQGLYALYDLDWLYTPGGLTGASIRGGVCDTSLTLGIPLQTGLDATLRLRYLAGGAEVPGREIFNWGQFVSATAGFRFSPMAFWDAPSRR
ncbi:MAG: hypothetical protein VKP62_04695 [Candidatus Sericytochromatia bacterium]|nr:hypothetical protein [Candidatus Sericytochromatia bacterium]